MKRHIISIVMDDETERELRTAARQAGETVGGMVRLAVSNLIHYGRPKKSIVAKPLCEVDVRRV